LRQVHGARVVVVDRPGEHAGAEADAAVTAVPGCTLVVRSADCAPLVLEGERTAGVVHAGWRGLLAGVVEAAADAMHRLGERPALARLGPCIRPGCYEFTGPELRELTRRFGDAVATRTMWGTPAFDLPEAMRVACADAGITRLQDDSGCTACDDRWFSHRARGDTARIATLAWLRDGTVT
jgi:polyphenol oxidase